MLRKNGTTFRRFLSVTSDNGTKVKTIRANSHKYSIRKMCKTLKISRNQIYYKPNYQEKRLKDIAIEKEIAKAFHESRKNYGTRKINKELIKIGIKVTRIKISKVMKKLNLV